MATRQGGKPEALVRQTTRPRKRPDKFPPCSRCGEKPCNKHTWRRKWTGGVGLCLSCYDAIRKQEKSNQALPQKPAPAEDQNHPARPAKVEATQSQPAGVSVLLKTIHSHDHAGNTVEAIARAHELVESLKAMGISVLVETRISVVPEETP